ncbi:unnamed protein product [Heterobilharzia americana]|nr:unnamed protein product [Heterobilharzia americana]
MMNKQSRSSSQLWRILANAIRNTRKEERLLDTLQCLEQKCSGLDSLVMKVFEIRLLGQTTEVIAIRINVLVNLFFLHVRAAFFVCRLQNTLMADYLKSAFSYFSTSNTNKNDNEFVGCSISVGQLNLKVKRVIAEGGYGIVYEAQDVNENIPYALKRMLAHDKTSADLILHEVRLLKQLSGHPNILKFFSAASMGREKMKVVGTEFLIVTEFCKGGQLNEYLPTPRCENPLSTNVILQIFYQCCRAVQHMHSQCPPVIHRDLKIENLLLTDHFIIKLCDFGSASTITYNPDPSWTALKRGITSFPIESGFEVLANVNSIEEMQSMLDARFPDAYAVYNLSTRAYRSDHWFHGRVSHRGFESHRAPSLKSLIELCLNARLWLSQKPNNICVIHCTDGKTLSAVLACSLLCFCQVFDNASPAIQLFASRRGNPGLNASQIRYIDYVAQLSHNRVFTPHHFPLNLISLTIAPVPTFNKSKNGCRPYVEIFEGKTRVCSTYTDYDNLRPYVLEDGKIEILLNGLTVLGDLTVIIYHCRSSFAGRGKISSVKIAQFQLHTGFVEHNLTELIYFKSDLDHLDNSGSFAGFTSRYAESFHVTLEFMVSPTERPRQSDNLVYPWETLPSEDLLRPTLCVSNPKELASVLSDFGRFNHKASVISKKKDYSECNQSNEGSSSSQDQLHTDKTTSKSEIATDVSGSTNRKDTEVHNLLVPNLISDVSINDTDPPISPENSNKPSVNNNVNFFDDEPCDNINLPSSSKEQSNTESDFVDLLGLHTESYVPTTDNTNEPILIDDGVNPVNSQNKASELKTEKQLFADDLFTFSPTAGNSSKIDLGWEDAFGKTSENTATSVKTTTASSSNNPFDPFGIATSGSESNFFSVPNFPNSQAQDKNSMPKDYFEQAGGHLSGSVSATNLNPSNVNPLFTSASYSNLSATTETASNTNAASAAMGSRDSPDPFADFASVLRDRLNNQNYTPTTTPVSNKTPTTLGGFSAGPSPVHHSRSGMDPKITKSSTKPDTNQQENTTNTSHVNEKSNQPHSSRSTFASTPTTSIPSSGTGARPQVKKDAFSDLLGGFGSSRTANTDDKQPKTVNQIRREKMAKTTDPEQMKVFDWAEGKDRNLRALLCSLPTILWDGVRWNHVGMADLITRDQVKRQYRNAARAVHPDKWMGTPYENMARLVFVELNDAMAEFDKDGNNSNNSTTNMNL